MNNFTRFCKLCFAIALFLVVLVFGTRDAQQAAAKPASWMPATPIPYPLASHLVKCVDDPDHFYLVGGAMNVAPVPLDILFRYTVSTGEWDQTLPPMPDVRNGVSAACYNGKIYVAGGYYIDGGYIIPTNTFFIYDIADGIWTEGTPLPDVLDFGGMGAWDGKLYVVGGLRNHDLPVLVDRVDVYDIASGQWTAGGGRPMPFAAGYFGFGAQAGPYFYVVGGFGNPWTTHVNQTQRYNMATNTWELGPLFTSARANHSVAVTATHLYAISGDLEGGGDYEPVGLVESLDLSNWPSVPWEDVQDPLPIPVIQGATTCSDILEGGEIWSVGGLRADLLLSDHNLYRPAEPCISYGAGLPGPMARVGVRGASVEYQLVLTNTGNVVDYYSLEVSSDWAFTAPVDDLGPIDPGESLQFVITVEIPPDASLGEQGITDVTATSISDFTAAASTSLTTTAVSWTPATPIPYPLLSHLVKCVDDPDHFYLLGGAPDMLTLSDDLLRYTISTGEWDQTLQDMPDVREGLMATCYQGKIYVAGGRTDLVITKTLFIYDINEDEWTTGTPLPDVLDFGGMGAWDGKLYVMGGGRSHQNFVPVDRVDVYDIASGEWTAGGGAHMPYPASHFGFGAQAGPYIYVVGGIGVPYETHVNQTQRYNMATNTWELGPEFSSARANHSVAVTSTHLYAISGDLEGGGDFEPVGLVEALDLSTWSSPDGAWEEVQDSVPTPVIQGASTCSNVLTGGEIWAVGGMNSGLIMVDVNEYLPTEPCVSFGADLSGALTGEGVPGSTVEYMLTLTNTGSGTDYYTLEISSNWGFVAPTENIGPIESGESMQLTIAVEIPLDAGPGDQDVMQVTAASISNLAVADSTTLTTTAIGQYQVDLQPISPISQAGHPGEQLTYILQVSNIGDFMDSYTVEISAVWNTVGPLTIGPLLPDESVELVITVSIPQGAMQGDTDLAMISIVSQADPPATSQVTLTSTAVFYRMLVPLVMKN